MTPLTALAVSLTRRLLWLIPPLLVLAVMGCNAPPWIQEAEQERRIRYLEERATLEDESHQWMWAYVMAIEEHGPVIAHAGNLKAAYRLMGDGTVYVWHCRLGQPSRCTFDNTNLHMEKAAFLTKFTPAPASAGKSGASTSARRP